MKISYYIFLLICCVFLSCSNESPVSPGGYPKQVNGRVVYGNIGVEGAKVMIESKIAITNAEGFFTIDDVSEPYNVKILNTHYDLTVGYEYIGLRNFTPILSGMGISSISHGASIRVTLPFTLTNSQRALIIFTNNDNVSASTIFSSNASSGYISIKWEGPTIVNGKMYVLIYSIVENQISNYNNFGEFDYSVTSNSQ